MSQCPLSAGHQLFRMSENRRADRADSAALELVAADQRSCVLPHVVDQPMTIFNALGYAGSFPRNGLERKRNLVFDEPDVIY